MFAEKVKSIPNLKLVHTMNDGLNLFTFYRKGAFTYVRKDHSPFPGIMNTTYYRSRYSGLLEFTDYSCDFNGVLFVL